MTTYTTLKTSKSNNNTTMATLSTLYPNMLYKLKNYARLKTWKLYIFFMTRIELKYLNMQKIKNSFNRDDILESK